MERREANAPHVVITLRHGLQLRSRGKFRQSCHRTLVQRAQTLSSRFLLSVRVEKIYTRQGLVVIWQRWAHLLLSLQPGSAADVTLWGPSASWLGTGSCLYLNSCSPTGDLCVFENKQKAERNKEKQNAVPEFHTQCFVHYSKFNIHWLETTKMSKFCTGITQTLLPFQIGLSCTATRWERRSQLLQQSTGWNK